MAGSWVENDFPVIEKLIKEFQKKIYDLQNKDTGHSQAGAVSVKIETSTYDGGDPNDLFCKKSLISRKIVMEFNLYGKDEDDE